MNQEPDNYEYDRDPSGGVIVWLVVAVGLAFLLGMICCLSGCTYTRNAPLINVQDLANGNTVPVRAAP